MALYDPLQDYALLGTLSSPSEILALLSAVRPSIRSHLSAALKRLGPAADDSDSDDGLFASDIVDAAAASDLSPRIVPALSQLAGVRGGVSFLLSAMSPAVINRAIALMCSSLPSTLGEECDVSLLSSISGSADVAASLSSAVAESVSGAEDGNALESGLPFSRLFVSDFTTEAPDGSWSEAAAAASERGDWKPVNKLLNTSRDSQSSRREACYLLLSKVSGLRSLFSAVIARGRERRVGTDDDRVEKSRWYRPRGAVYSVGFLFAMWELALRLREDDGAWTDVCLEVRRSKAPRGGPSVALAADAAYDF